MPIYEYRCENCGREFEEWQKITDPAIDKCSVCGGKASRLISHSSFVLKGTGWYVTDYARKDGSSSPTPSSAKKSSDSENKSSGDSKGSSED
jgi:putative FmdB family regulatory protein